MAKRVARLVALLTPKRRWAQFSLGTMFVVVSALCVWLGVVVNRANRQREAVAAIEKLGGRVVYIQPGQLKGETFPRPFLRRWLPRDYFDEVQGLHLRGTQVTDAGLSHLHGLTRLERLDLDGTQVTDSGLSHLRGLTRLEALWLNGTQVTDAGLTHLRGLTRLVELDLDGTQVNDAGLAHLRGLTGLKVLWLNDTQTTDAGLAQLRQALPKCVISGP